MLKREKKWFIIDSAVGPIYSEPNFHSSCLSEAVYGESCEILGKQDNWLEIKCEDGYRGWINSFYGYISSEKNKPSEVLKLAVKRMLPSGPLAKKQLTKLKIYTGENHPHTAQNPQVIQLDKLNSKNIARN